MTTGVLPTESSNVARFVSRRCEEAPGELAVAAPQAGGHASFAQWTWADLEQRSSALARGLRALGLAAEDRVCVFVRPGLEWIALIHGLFKLGAVPVLIDPGMGRRGVLGAIERVRPRALIAVPTVHAARVLQPAAFRSVEIAVTSGWHRLWTSAALLPLMEQTGEAFAPIPRAARDPAAILFTSGSTGPAKGVCYEHGMFQAQVEMLRATYDFAPGSRDLACFPLFALFGPALGMASVFPEMDFTRPAGCDPSKIAGAIERFQVRSSFGSPAIWRRVIPWCEARSLRLDSLRQLLIAGAPVEADLVRRARDVIAPGGEVFTPYGATEALPVTHVEGALLAGELGTRASLGEGTCVGRAVWGVDLRLIRIGDVAIEHWDDELFVQPGEAGEICVRGDNVTREYAFDPQATALAKIRDGDRVWHRMGDLGRFDAQGQLWFLGRKSHRLETASGMLFPVPIENVFRLHAAIGRCAVVGLGQRGSERPILIVELSSGKIPRRNKDRERVAAEILQAGAALSGGASVERVLFKRDFPLDVRHQAKIDRIALKHWAQEQVL